MMKKKVDYNFDIVFQKLAELKGSKEQIISRQESDEFQEINELREIVLDVSEENEKYFSTT